MSQMKEVLLLKQETEEPGPELEEVEVVAYMSEIGVLEFSMAGSKDEKNFAGRGNWRKVRVKWGDTMTLQDRLSEIEGRANKATPGPWRTEYSPLEEFENEEWIIYGPDDENLCASNYYSSPGIKKEVDARLIAHARTDIPKLVKALRSVERTLKEITNTTRVDDPNNHLAEHLKYLASNELTKIERILNAEGEG